MVFSSFTGGDWRIGTSHQSGTNPECTAPQEDQPRSKAQAPLRSGGFSAVPSGAPYQWGTLLDEH